MPLAKRSPVRRAVVPAMRGHEAAARPDAINLRLLTVLVRHRWRHPATYSADGDCAMAPILVDSGVRSDEAADQQPGAGGDWMDTIAHHRARAAGAWANGENIRVT